MKVAKYKQFKFSSEKFIKYKDLIIISDLHFGKAEHFNLNGIKLPHASEDSDLFKILEIIKKNKPKTLIFLGDLFHAKVKVDLEKFNSFITKLIQYTNNDSVKLEIVLIKGNHDKHSNLFYKKLGIVLLDELEIENMIFTHKPLNQIVKGKINIAGHIHPGVILGGKAKQYLRLPCFAVKENQIILPSFGYMTGSTNKTLEKFKLFYAIADDQILKVERINKVP